MTPGHVWTRTTGALILSAMGWLGFPELAHGFGNGAALTGEFAIETWTTDNGMPHNSVTAILQTSNGYIWAGTYNGLAQFDGDRFKVLDPSNTKGLTNSRITSLYEDLQGDIWIGHESGEVTRCSGERFEPVALRVSWENIPVIGFGNDEQGELWILNLRGEVLRFRDSLLLKPLPLMAAEPSATPEMSSDRQHHLYVLRNGAAARVTPDGYQEERFGSQATRPYHARLTRARQGGVWVAGENWVRKWDGQKWEKNFGPFPWGDAFVTTMLETSRHRVLVGTLLGGLYVLNEPGGWSRLSRTNGLPQDWIRCLTEDREQNIWVGTSGGLAVLRERKVVMHIPPDDLEGRPVMGITQARDGAIWAASEGAGVYRMMVDTWTHFGVSEGLSNLFVWSVMEDSQGKIWAGTWGGGLFQLHGEKFVRQFELAELAEPVTALKEHPPGTIWIGTGAGLMRFARPVKGSPRGGPRPDEPFFHGASNQLERFAALGGAAAGAVRAIEVGARDEIWFGTQNSGLGRIRAGKLTSYGSRSSESRVQRPESEVGDSQRDTGLDSGLGTGASGLPPGSVLSLHYDAEGVLWIGTHEKGVSRFKNNRFAAITTDQGLPNNIIDHIEEDGLGNFWFNSQNGIFRVSRRELNDCADGKTNLLQALVFGKAEGMITLVGSGGFTPSGFRAPDGKLWFPTARGLAVVNPASVRPNRIPPPVLIEEILVDGQRAGVRVQSPESRVGNSQMDARLDSGLGTRDSGLRPTRRIEVPPGRRQVDVKFTGMSFTAPARVQFKYWLEGIDPDWTQSGTRRRVNYSYLPPGEFVFHVIASNSDGLWNEIGDAVTIVVQPHYWQTWWFKTLLAAAAAALVGGGVFFESRGRMKTKLERLGRERELERERARIAQDIHDDLGASLTRIGMLSQSAAGELNEPQRAAESLNLIHATTGELTRAMDEIVWAVNPRHDTLESLSNYISRFAQEFLGAAQIRCRLAMPLQVPELSVRSEVRHNLFLAFKEAMHNAVKHSGANEVRITVQFLPGGFQLVIADNGAGFDPKRPGGKSERNRAAPGNGLRNIRSRLAQIGGRSDIYSATGEGTRVELFVPLPDFVVSPPGRA